MELRWGQPDSPAPGQTLFAVFAIARKRIEVPLGTVAFIAKNNTSAPVPFSKGESRSGWLTSRSIRKDSICEKKRKKTKNACSISFWLFSFFSAIEMGLCLADSKAAGT